MEAPGSSSPSAPRGRWKRRWLVAALALVVLVLGAPLYVGPIVRGVLVRGLSERLGTEVRVQTVSFAWPASLHVHALIVEDGRGQALASVDDVYVDLELLPLLSGGLRADVRVEYPELVLAQGRDGGWNWRGPLERAEEAAARRAGADGARQEDDLPGVRARVTVLGGRMVVRTEDGETSLEDLALELELPGLDEEARFTAELGVRGPDGPSGGLRVEGAVTVAPRGLAGGLAPEGRATLALEGVGLAALLPAVSTVAPVMALEGTARGDLELELGSTGVRGRGDATIEGLGVRGPRGGAPAALGRLALEARASQGEDGSGEQQVTFTLGELLVARLEGTSRAPDSGPGEARGDLEIQADLASLTELAAQWLPVREGVRVEGRLGQSLGYTVALADRRPSGVELTARGGLTGLAGSDAEGRALDLSDLERLSLELEARADLAAGTLSVPRLVLDAGPLRCEGGLEAELDADGAVQPRGGTLELSADLERLRGTLAQVVDLEGEDLGGRLQASARMTAEGDGQRAECRLSATDLRFAGAGVDTLEGRLDARRAPDGALEGSGGATLGATRLRYGDGETLELPGMTLELTLAQAADGTGLHTLRARDPEKALQLGVEARTEPRPAGALGWSATLNGEADLGLVAPRVAAFLPLRPGIAGRALLDADLDGVWTADGPGALHGEGEVLVDALEFPDARGEPTTVRTLSPASVTFQADADLPAGTLALRDLRLTAPGATLGLAASVRRLPDGTPLLEEARLDGRVDLALVGSELALGLDTGGWGVDGGVLRTELTVLTLGPLLDARGKLAADRVTVERPDDAPLTLAELNGELELTLDPVADRLEIGRADLHADTLALGLTGTVEDLRTPEETRGTLEVTLTGRLERLLADLGLAPTDGRRATGGLRTALTLEGGRSRVRCTGEGTLADLVLELPADPSGRPALELREPSLALGWDASIALPDVDVDIARLTLASGIARGGASGRIENLARLEGEEVRFAGLTGDLVYVPERLGALLGPLLPGTLGGTEEERVTFTLDGRARDLDLASVLAGSEGRVDLGIGSFVRPEIALGGTLGVEARDGLVQVRGDLGANGGDLRIDATLALADDADDADEDAREPARSKLTVSTRSLRATPGLAPILGLVHPAFAGVEAANGTLDGLVDLQLDLGYEGALTPERLAAGWQALPKSPISGSGRFEVRQARLRDSPLLAAMRELGLDTSKSLTLRPIEFSVQKGRLTYARPWTWSIGGTETTFTGSIGLDESLDLAWNLPIGPALVERWSFLASLQGQTLSVPLRGSVRAPKLELKGLLEDLAARAARAELESRLGLGGGAEDPSTLLRRADELWDAGKKVEAAALYERIREEFKLSLTYVANRDRIKDRAKYRPPEPPR